MAEAVHPADAAPSSSTHPNSRGAAEVVQADRDAAADWLFDDGIDMGYCADVREGRCDHHLTRAFARHRTRQANDAVETVAAILQHEGLPNYYSLAIEVAAALSAASPTAVVEEGLVEELQAMLAQYDAFRGVSTQSSISIRLGGFVAKHREPIRAALSASRARIEAEVIEKCAGIAEQWRDENKASAAKARKRERLHGIGGYESPQMADQLEGAAIECNAIAAAIRALPITKAGERDNGDERD